MNTVQILSGIGVKGPACILLSVNGQRWLLDCGEGPDEHAHFDPAWLKGVDAVFITHDHIDHIGGAAHAVAAGIPIYATRQTAKLLPKGADLRVLPAEGQVEIAGVQLTLGSNGHALGGVWMHFAIGDGLFYSGDWSEESAWFVFCDPPRAKTAILDCSYHLDPIAQTDRLAALDQLMDGLSGQVLLPVPPSGRAGELALRLLQTFGPQAVALDPVCQNVLRAAIGQPDVSPQARDIAPLLEKPFDQEARFLICDTPNAEAGTARHMVDLWRDQQRLGQDAHVVFTGHTNEFAREICAAPGGHFQRWNVHPPLGDQRRMIERLGAKRFAPAFCKNPEAYAQTDTAGADIFLQESIAL